MENGVVSEKKQFVSMKSSPKVSVIIPVWNPGPGISRCVESLRGQTLGDIEKIFVDDCGTDGAMEVVRAAAAEDPRIRIITNAENVGPGISRNRGIEAAIGEYLSFVDADDYVNKSFLERLYAKAVADKLDIVKGKNVYEKEDGNIIEYPDRNEMTRKGLQAGKPLFCLFKDQHQSALYRRAWLLKYGIRFGSSHRAEDKTFLLQACHWAERFDFEETAEYHYCEREGSSMFDMHPRTLERKLHAFQERMDYIVENMVVETNSVMHPQLIVSFTSYPARIQTVPKVLESLYAQTMQPDKILLWLAEEQFPNREADLPRQLVDDAAAGKFELRWCDNLGSHKKYFYAMQEYPEDIIVTVDDDIFYHQEMLQTLMDGHTRFPRSVVARTASVVLLDSKLNPLPIVEWLFDFQSLTEPSMLLMAIGVGGVLYPPHSVNERIFDKEFILEACTVNGRTFGDDLLLKVGEMLNNTSVVSVECEPYRRLPNTQETALAKLMPKENHKNLLIKKCKDRFQDAFDGDSAHRLETAISEFEEMDHKLGLKKKYMLTRPSRDLIKQLWYLSLPDAPSKPDASDYRKVKDIARLAARVFTAYPPDNSDDETARAFRAFRQELLDIPGIANLAETDVVICGLIDYGVPLNEDCHILYRGIPIYMKSLHNWQSLMANHPNCKPIFRKGYEAFLRKTEVKIGQAESVLSKTEIDEWKLAYEKAIREYRPSNKTNMKRTIRTFIAKIPLARPLYHTIKQRREL